MDFFADPVLNGGVPMEYLDAFEEGGRPFDGLPGIEKATIAARDPERIAETVMKVVGQNAVLFKMRVMKDHEVKGRALLLLYERDSNPEDEKDGWKSVVVRYAPPVRGIDVMDVIFEASRHFEGDVPFRGANEALKGHCVVKLLKNAYHYNLRFHEYTIELDS